MGRVFNAHLRTMLHELDTLSTILSSNFSKAILHYVYLAFVICNLPPLFFFFYVKFVNMYDSYI